MRLRTVIAAILLLLPLVSCEREGGRSLAVTAVDFGFVGVDEEITGGVIDLVFHNRGQAKHEFVLVSAPNVAATAFVKAFKPALQGGPFPKYATAGGAIGEVEPGDTLRSRFTVPAGSYMLFCALEDERGGNGPEQSTGKAHYDLGMIQTVRVVGEAGKLTAAAGGFTAKDYTFTFPGTAPDGLKGGKRTYVFRNGSTKQWHHMILNEFPAGVTPKEAEKAFRTLLELPQGKAPPKGTPMPQEGGGTGVLAPGSSQTLKLNLDAGRTYVAVCFIQDVTGGPPHAVAHNMVKAFAVGD